jgi:hypothetical protein
LIEVGDEVLDVWFCTFVELQWHAMETLDEKDKELSIRSKEDPLQP